MVKVQGLFAKTNLKIPVCRTDKIPLGTKGRTSILSCREYRASCGASFPVSRRKLLDRECFVTSFRQSVPLRYNYDKPEKPRRIKGFEVFSLVFSSFSKPKNHTEISRIIGGVSLTTNEQQKGTQSLLISNTVEYWIQAKPSLVSSGGFCHFQDCCAGT